MGSKVQAELGKAARVALTGLDTLPLALGLPRGQASPSGRSQRVFSFPLL